MIYLDAGATTLQKPPAVALAVQSAMRRMATPGRGGAPPPPPGPPHAHPRPLTQLPDAHLPRAPGGG